METMITVSNQWLLWVSIILWLLKQVIFQFRSMYKIKTSQHLEVSGANTRSSHRRCFVKKRYSWKFRKFYRKTPVLESLFNKVAGLCFPVKFAKFLRAPILKNTYGGCFCNTFLILLKWSWLLWLKGDFEMSISSYLHRGGEGGRSNMSFFLLRKIWLAP